MDRKKVLLLGATGMLGHVAYHYLKSTNKYAIVNVVFRNKLTEDSLVIDITNKLAVEKLIETVKPDIILNCIGVLLKGSELYFDNSIYINSYFPHLLERLTINNNAKLIHISTDCVFSGKKGSYAETDIRDADDIYGKSKGLGEVINNKDLTIRTSIIGPELKINGEGLFHWFMNQDGEINGFTNAFWSGVTTLELSKAIHIAIKQNITGLVHLTSGEKISKFDLIYLFKEIWKKDSIIIKSSQAKTVDKSLKKSENFSYEVPTYKKMLEDILEFMIRNKSLYKEYL